MKLLHMNSAKQPLINKVGKQNETENEYSCINTTLVFLSLIALSMTLFWVIFLPRWPIITVKDALIDNYTLTGHNHLNAAFKFAVRVHNPNSKLSLYYDHVEFKAYHGGQTVAFDGVEPFSQTHGNLTLLNFGGSAIDLPLFEPLGEVDLVLELKGRLWFKAGTLTLYWYDFEVLCFPVVVYLDRVTEFERCSCYLINI